ncbi:hypothetical protein [Deinococcus detaillensis]|uniref:hypothetical protein n=1 Tax=Deinococcus detaillensis TaxID=2592048 RepID=UPI00163DCBB3|nr:hypothetical protein [Deinococcus detaillensis]
MSALVVSPSEVWSDVYGAVHARFEGRVGGHAWLVAAAPETARATADALSALLAAEGQLIKGHLELLIHDHLTPLERTLSAQPFSGVVVIGAAVAAGPAVQVAQQMQEAESGLSYLEGGAFPAWQAALVLSGAGESGENAAASVCAAHSVAVVVCPAQRLAEVLLLWAGGLPQGLAQLG